MIAAVSPGSKLGDVPADAAELHLVRPVKSELISGILRKCSSLEKISLSKSCLRRMPVQSRQLLQHKGIALVEQNRPGRPIGLPLQKMLHALEMRKDHQTLREIERVTGIPKSTVHYLQRYAQRTKIKNGKNIVYLK